VRDEQKIQISKDGKKEADLGTAKGSRMKHISRYRDGSRRSRNTMNIDIGETSKGKKLTEK